MNNITPAKKSHWNFPVRDDDTFLAGEYSRTECMPFEACGSSNDLLWLTQKSLMMAFTNAGPFSSSKGSSSRDLIYPDAFGWQVRDRDANIITDIETTAAGRKLLEDVCGRLVEMRHRGIRAWANDPEIPDCPNTTYWRNYRGGVCDEDIRHALRTLFIPKIEPGHYRFDDDYAVWQRFLDFSYLWPQLETVQSELTGPP